MTWAFFFVAGGISLAITGSAVLALYWAARNNQLDHLQKGAESIFDDDEPIGKVTDRFPGEAIPKEHNSRNPS